MIGTPARSISNPAFSILGSAIWPVAQAIALGPVADLLPSLDEATRSEVERRVDAAFLPFVSDGEASFTAACWMVTARAS